MNPSIYISPPPAGLHHAYSTLFSPEAIQFLSELVTTFANRVDELHWNRFVQKCQFIVDKDSLPTFARSPQRSDKSWKVRPVPPRLQNRRLDLGDVSPANTDHFLKALNADVQGIQVDFDDGHCPTWTNQIKGLHNVYRAIHGHFTGIRIISELPILMLRPRAWNMTEHNIKINGKETPGPLIDFGLLMFHNSGLLTAAGAGPFFYLSKLERATEARLWNDIFTWTQQKLGIPHGTIKACVLIENILSSFEMEEILYELRDHSLGLNCGIWDYAASIICKFGNDVNFVLPDRNKYVNMQRHFLHKYMQLVIQTCHMRGAHATGGMAALLVPTGENRNEVIGKVVQSKRLEILAGVDGFMVYDLQLVPYINKLWTDQCGSNINQINLKLNRETIDTADLLKMPTGGVTYEGLKHNIAVAVLFIYNWFKGNGHFYYKGAVEDSATAEISRSQIWQWIRHKATIEDNGEVVTKTLVQSLTKEYLRSQPFEEMLQTAAEIFFDVVTLPCFPDFITTHLNDHYTFRKNQEEDKCITTNLTAKL